MATGEDIMTTETTRYRCPVTPDECPSSTRRGFCQTHEWERLVPERVYLVAESEDDAAQTSGPGGDDSGAAGQGSGGSGVAGSDSDGSGTDARSTDARRGGPARAAGPGRRNQGPTAPNRESTAPNRERPAPNYESTAPNRERPAPHRDRPASSQGDGRRNRPPRPAGPTTDGPHAPSGRSTPAVPPTRLQSTPTPTPRPRQDTSRRAAPAPAAPCLALVLAGALIPVRGVDQDPTQLGRDAPECAHVPGLAALDQLSRAHAELHWHAGRLYITDTDSSNGTYVDDELITRPTQLWPGGHRLRLAEDVDVDVVELDEYGAPR
ncbi:FHA domain-containing protein [Streptomyces sp. NPDC048275]|uniref:FHA domain-containing protein n=1 Tax=Streptomyces sp. NPDC048275 TaxID=3155629 RepID=UPI0033D5E793